MKIVDGADSRLTAAAVGALGSIGDQRAVRPLIDLFYGTGDAYATVTANALAKIDGPQVSEFVRDNINCRDEKRQMVALYIVQRTKDRSLIPFMKKAIIRNDDAYAKNFAVPYFEAVNAAQYCTIAEWKAWAGK